MRTNNSRNIYRLMNASVSSQKARIKFHRKLFERIKESKWGTSSKYM